MKQKEEPNYVRGRPAFGLDYVHDIKKWEDGRHACHHTPVLAKRLKDAGPSESFNSRQVQWWSTLQSTSSLQTGSSAAASVLRITTCANSHSLVLAHLDVKQKLQTCFSVSSRSASPTGQEFNHLIKLAATTASTEAQSSNQRSSEWLQ